MDTNRLRQFCTVVKVGSLRKASEIIGISHSGLFKSLRALEQELGGVKLTRASGRGIVITDEGQQLYERSDSFFHALDTLTGGNATAPSPPLRLGSSEAFTVRFLGSLLRTELSGQTTEIHDLVPGKIEEALANHRIDIGITYEPVPRKGMDYVQTGQVKMGAFAARGRFRNEPLHKIPFVAPISPLEGSPSGAKGLDGWPEERFSRNVVYRVDLLETGFELVRQGLAAIFIPTFVAELHNRAMKSKFSLEKLPTPQNFKSIVRPVYIVKRESTEESPTIQAIARALRKL